MPAMRSSLPLGTRHETTEPVLPRTWPRSFYLDDRVTPDPQRKSQHRTSLGDELSVTACLELLKNLLAKSYRDLCLRYGDPLVACVLDDDPRQSSTLTH